MIDISVLKNPEFHLTSVTTMEDCVEENRQLCKG